MLKPCNISVVFYLLYERGSLARTKRQLGAQSGVLSVRWSRNKNSLGSSLTQHASGMVRSGKWRLAGEPVPRSVLCRLANGAGT